MRVSVGKKGYGIEFENGKSLENNGYKKRDIGYISHFKCVESEGFEPSSKQVMKILSTSLVNV